MKTIARTLSIVVSAIALFIMVGSTNVQAQQENVSFQIFYDQLSPYGEWIDDPNYGYIWLPDVGPDFQPYASNGRWVNTQYGNTWYSNYDWGWAPFHYGRWVSSDYGWAWVPGYEWGPAWVSWRQGGGQYGWAPLGPGMSFSVNINIPLRNWIFVPQRYFFNTNVYRYYTPYRRYNSFYNRTTIINNVYVYNNHHYYSGPDRHSLEQTTRRRVDVREVRNSTRPGRNSINDRSVEMYRPTISTSGNTNARPTRVVSADKATTRPSANATTRPSSNVRPSRGNTATNGAVNSPNATTRPSRTPASRTNENRPASPENNSNARPSRNARPGANTNETKRATPTATERPTRNARPQSEQQPKTQNATPRTERTAPTRTTPNRPTPAATRPANQDRNTSRQTNAPRENVSRRNTANAPANRSVSSRSNESKPANTNNRSTRPSREN